MTHTVTHLNPLPAQHPGTHPAGIRSPQAQDRHLHAGHGAGCLGAVRIGDAERDQVCHELAEHHAAGRLTPAEVDQRTGEAINAQTLPQLLALTADLPPLVTPARPWVAPAPTNWGRNVALAGLGVVAGLAAICTVGVLFLLGMASSSTFGAALLVGFGSSVATVGATVLLPKLFRNDAPAQQALHSR